MKLNYLVLDLANPSESIDIIGDYDPEDNSFDPYSAIVTKGRRSMDSYEVLKFSGVIDFLLEGVDFRAVYRESKFQYA